MGVINMAHGELLMIGAYATYMVQNVFKAYLPGYFDFYIVAAIPAAFLASALVGAAMERSVIRFLYGRPLETLLATWGISLVLMQGVRSLFGAQNVQVENPAWLSGGVQALSNLHLAVQPHRDHRVRGACFGRARVHGGEDAAGPFRSLRHAEPADGGLHGREHREGRHLRVRARGRASPGWLAALCRK